MILRLSNKFTFLHAKAYAQGAWLGTAYRLHDEGHEVWMSQGSSGYEVLTDDGIVWSARFYHDRVVVADGPPPRKGMTPQ